MMQATKLDLVVEFLRNDDGDLRVIGVISTRHGQKYPNWLPVGRIALTPPLGEYELVKGPGGENVDKFANWCAVLACLYQVTGRQALTTETLFDTFDGQEACVFRKRGHGETDNHWLARMLGALPKRTGEQNSHVVFQQAAARNNSRCWKAALRRPSDVNVSAVELPQGDRQLRTLPLSEDELKRYLKAKGIRWEPANPKAEKGAANRKGKKPREWKVPLQEFGRFLKQYRDVIGMTDEIRAYRLGELTGKVGISKEDLDSLENERLTGTACLSDLLDFCRVYDDSKYDTDMPELMAMWLCSQPLKAPWIRYRREDFDEVPLVSENGTKTMWAPFRERLRAVGFHYMTPSERLENLDCAIGLCEIEGNARQDLTQLHDEFGSLSEETFKDVPRSRRHQHMGDELVICLSKEAKVLVEFANSGLRASLRQGDLIHFNSDVPHSVWNFGDKRATILVLRFFQIDRHGTRQDQINAIQQLRSTVSRHLGDGKSSPEERRGEHPVSSARKKSTAHGLRHSAARLGKVAKELEKTAAGLEELYLWWTELEPWLRDRMTPSKIPLNAVDRATTRVSDWIGLTGMLELLCRVDPRVGIEDSVDGYRELRGLLNERARMLARIAGSMSDSSELAKTTLELIKLLHKLRSDSQSPLAALAAVLRPTFEPGPDPQPDYLNLAARFFDLPVELLLGSLAPPVLRSVVLRCHDNDWISAAGKFDSNRSDGYSLRPRYSIPSRVLANSDISLNRLDFPGGAESALNWHAGFELAYVEQGAIQVHLEAVPQQPPSCKAGEIIIFRSQIVHRISNASPTEVARILLIRFNVIDPLRVPSAPLGPPLP